VGELAAQMIAESDFVFHYTATQLIHHGQAFGFAPTGKQVVSVNCSLDEVQGDAIVQHNGASDWPVVLREIGAPYVAGWPLPTAPAALPIGGPDTSAAAAKAIVANLLGALLRGEHAEEHPGAGELRQEFAAVRAAFPDAALTVVRQIVEGDLVGTRATLAGTHSGPLHGIAPTGRAVSWDLFVLNRVAGGRVVDHLGTVGWIDVLGKIGVLPPPGAR
jgi:predicted ester cyclase